MIPASPSSGDDKHASASEQSRDLVDDFDPLLNEEDAILGTEDPGLRRTGSLLAAATLPENEEERREEEDVVPDNLSRLPPGSGAGAGVLVAGRFTTTPAMRLAPAATEGGGANTGGGGAEAISNLARSLPVSVPVPENVARAPDLPPEVDQVGGHICCHSLFC